MCDRKMWNITVWCYFYPISVIFAIGQFHCICFLWFPLSTRFIHIDCSPFNRCHESINAYAWITDSVQRKIITLLAYDSLVYLHFFHVDQNACRVECCQNKKQNQRISYNTRTDIHTLLPFYSAIYSTLSVWMKPWQMSKSGRQMYRSYSALMLQAKFGENFIKKLFQWA